MKVRWNTLLYMLKRFLEILKPMQKAMVDWNLNISITKEDVRLIERVSDFEPLELVLKKLCERETTVLIGYIATESAIRDLAEHKNNQLSVRLSQCLKERLKQRTKTDFLLHQLKLNVHFPLLVLSRLNTLQME